jgi:acetyl-CoA acyltransferase
MQESRPGRRVAIVAGARTPFLKSGTAFRDVTAVALARHVARELLFRSEVDGREVDEVIFSQVVPSVLAPNVAREVSLLPQFLPSVPAYTLNRACASSAQAIANAADQIALGHADTILAGGVETLSDIPILHSRRFSRVLVDASRAKSLGGRVAAFGRTRPRDLVPVTPAIAEPSTGESMGQSAEKMAKENGIDREAQDDLALRSHRRAAAATADGRLTAEIAPWFGGTAMDQPVTADNGIRADTTPAQSPPATPRPLPTALPRSCSWPKRRPPRWATGRWPISGATPWPRWTPAGSSSWDRCTRCPRRWNARASHGVT